MTEFKTNQLHLFMAFLKVGLFGYGGGPSSIPLVYKGVVEKYKVKFVMGTVAGNLHDIGKDLVCMMLEGAGFEVIDLGIGVNEDTFVEAVIKHKASFLGMPALLTTTMPKMKTTIEAFTAAGIRDKVKIMIGGAPITDDFARSIGADAYAPDASAAMEVANKLSL